ncbi:MAG: hypothetical protein HS115_12860 [Spirochaetales bacterium]|nr:hypothetical protein [Spirochaetales bacterium]
MLKLSLPVVLSLLSVCQSVQKNKAVPPGWQEIHFEKLRWIVRGEKSQEERRAGFAMQLFVDHTTQNVFQLGILDLTAAEVEQARREPDELIEQAFLRYFQTLRGARRESDFRAKHQWSGREYLWTMERNRTLIEGRTRIYLTADSRQTIVHSILYERARRDLPAIRVYFQSLEGPP